MSRNTGNIDNTTREYLDGFIIFNFLPSSKSYIKILKYYCPNNNITIKEFNDIALNKRTQLFVYKEDIQKQVIQNRAYLHFR